MSTKSSSKLQSAISVENVGPTTPLRLQVAARLAFPDGSLGVPGLRNEIAKGRLRCEKIANKLYTTLEAIEEMRSLCRVKSPPETWRQERSLATEQQLQAAQDSLQRLVQMKLDSLRAKKKQPLAKRKNVERG
ncbi:hypothetical protein LRP30_02985 [Bradyrhizobium sp. C-145]|uniref:hypothetical protein n=1 Tax=Bradyrhizobium sp. C-145 TaxID=574727 RepID=UPI00201B6A91|nr:hypothetical protein [Bradyrhizobium sp. C-145]UQR64301.1 hypothetical protein LRP30_02985 [Bradyrhizobium sp. C-145]